MLNSIWVHRNSPSMTHIGIAGLMILVAIIELTTPPDYVFGYLYIGPILLATARLSRVFALNVTLLATGLTLLNAWFPAYHLANQAVVASRLIAGLAMIVTALLGDRNRFYEQALSQQQAKLQAQEKLASIREDFVSTLTHDLKTPLLGAIAALKAFQEGNFGAIAPTQAPVLTALVHSHQTSLHLVETLLDIYRNDAQGLQLQLAPLDLASLAEEVAKTLMAVATARRVYITLNYGESDFRQALWVHGDAFQLRRVLSNLLMNAIQHSRRDGRVEIILTTQGTEHIVKILDNGAGMTAAELPHLFERFYQGHSDRQVSGSGLGLYLSRQIIAAHGGTIWAENRPTHPSAAPLSTGALFGFKLPAYPSFPTA